MRLRCAVAPVLIVGGLLLATSGAENARMRPQFPERIEAGHLPNVFRIHERVLSGGQPEGERGFRELRDLGVRTIISVDGAKPDLEAARKYGLRYVHLPHGYDGIPQARVQELAKAVRDLEGPVYIHCHHGKHRSPAAAAVACVAAGLLDPRGAVAVLETAGTSRHYVGLYQSAAGARRLDETLLDDLAVDFPETATLPPMAEAMVEIEHMFDRLKRIEQSGWRSPAAHPDLEPAHEALLLREQFTELLRTDGVRGRPEDFRELLRESEETGRKLEAALRMDSASGEAGAAFRKIAKNCAACHVKYRDVPLEQKSDQTADFADERG